VAGFFSQDSMLTKGALRVPQITVYFWIVKALSTAMGEATSDALVGHLGPIPAVLLGFLGFVGALALQFHMQRYVAWTYWLAVAGVGVFGTMAADVLHVGFKVPYFASTALYGVILIAVFYWAAVVATFAVGTAAGDLTATTFHLGYGWSIILFAGIVTVPAIGYRFFHWNGILSFWFAYVITRPIGASTADWLGKPKVISGLGHGDGVVAITLAIIFVVLVAFLALSGKDVQGVSEDAVSNDTVSDGQAPPSPS
jgi:uncharacterized membrane-anchored protein